MDILSKDEVVKFKQDPQDIENLQDIIGKYVQINGHYHPVLSIEPDKEDSSLYVMSFGAGTEGTIGGEFYPATEEEIKNLQFYIEDDGKDNSYVTTESKLQEEDTENNIDMELAKYLYNESEGDVEYIPDHEDVVYYYSDDITEEVFTKTYEYVKNLIESIKYYNSEGTILIELSDNRTMQEITNDNIEAEEYWTVANLYLETFEMETGVEVYTEGRSSRHICVANTFENAKRYKELQQKQQELEQQFINEINNTETDLEESKLEEHKIVNDENIDAIKDNFTPPGAKKEEDVKSNSVEDAINMLDKAYDKTMPYLDSKEDNVEVKTQDMKDISNYTGTTLDVLNDINQNGVFVQDKKKKTENVEVYDNSINPQDSDYYEDLYTLTLNVSKQDGTYETKTFSVYANCEQDALEMLIPYLETNNMLDCLINCDTVNPEETSLVYVDGTEYGATQPYYLDMFTEDLKEEKFNKYEIEWNSGAVERTSTPNETVEFEGSREDLMQFLDDNYVDVDYDEDDNIISFEEWLDIYEDMYDPSGSTVVLSIKENGKEIYKNSDYNYYQEEQEDYDDDDDDYNDMEESKHLNEEENSTKEENEETTTILDELQNRIGQTMDIGEFNNLLQAVFGKYNTIFLTTSALYDIEDWNEPQELVVFDDSDMYTITYLAKDVVDNPSVEITDVTLD